MSSYLMHRLDEQLWRKVKAKAATEGVSIRDVILRLLTDWVQA